MLQKITAKLNLDANPEPVIVKTAEEAIRYRHIGGPTIHVTGQGIEPDAQRG